MLHFLLRTGVSISLIFVVASVSRADTYEILDGCVSSKPVRRAWPPPKCGEWRRPLRRFLPDVAMVQTTNARQSHDSRAR